MIRAATLDDIPRLLEMGSRFAKLANLSEHVGYDPDSMAETFKALIDGGHPVFISETGAIGATQSPHPFNHRHITAQELFWWSEGGGGTRLLKAMIEHCERHCHSLQMITLEAVRPDAVGKLYERMGFRPLERSYVKVF